MRGFDSYYSCLKNLIKNKLKNKWLKLNIKFNKIKNPKILLRLANNIKSINYYLTRQKHFFYDTNKIVIKNKHSIFFILKKKKNIRNIFFFSIQYEKSFFFFFKFFFNNLNNIFFFSKIKNYNEFNIYISQIIITHIYSFFKKLNMLLIFFSYYNNFNFISLKFYFYLTNIFNKNKFFLNYFKIENNAFLNNFFRHKTIRFNYTLKKKIKNIFFKNSDINLLQINNNSLSIFKFLNLKKKIKNVFFKNSFFFFLYKSKIYYKNIIWKNIKILLNIFKISQFDNNTNMIKLSTNSINLNKFNFILNNTYNSFIYKKCNFKILYFFNKFISNKKFFNFNFNFFFKKKKLSCYFSFFKKKVNKFQKNSNFEFILNNNNFFYSIKNNFFKNNKIFNYYKPRIFKINNFWMFSKLEFLFFFFFKPLFFKFFFVSKLPFNPLCNFLILANFKNNFFNFNNKFIANTNLISNKNFDYILKKKIIKIFDHDKISLNTTLWYNETLIRFLENCSGKKIYLKVFSFLNNNLDFFEKTQCLLWSQKVKYFRKVLGPRLFLNESLQILYLSLKLKDPTILSNWMVATMGKISFWKFKTFLRYIKYVLRYFFWVIFKEIKIKGVKFQLKGKISVAGNSRTRTAFHYVGFTSHATFDNKILYTLNLVKTFTGVLGLKLWIVF